MQGRIPEVLEQQGGGQPHANTQAHAQMQQVQQMGGQQLPTPPAGSSLAATPHHARGSCRGRWGRCCALARRDGGQPDPPLWTDWRWRHHQRGLC